MTEKIQITLAAARVNAGLTQEDVAKSMNVSKNTVVNWEKGKTDIDYSKAKALSNLYRMPLDNIIFLHKKSN